MTYYKLLNKGRIAPMQGWQWPRVGAWTPKVEEVIVCNSGYHAMRGAPKFDLLEWSGDELYEVELRGTIIEYNTKVVASQAKLVRRVKRWNEKNLRLFACDCAARALKHYEAKYPDDNRPREAISVARQYAVGKATIEELAAARDAAWAARDAAWAARAAAWAAARDAAWATRDAAWAARAAAGDAAWAAEKKWQINRLMQYINGEVA